MASKKSNNSVLSIPGNKAGECKIISVGDLKIAFRWCPPDTFTMGSPEDEEGRRDDEKLHKVTFSKGFWIMETPVTVGMFEAFVEDNKYQSVGYSPWALDGNRIKQNKKRNFSWRNPGYEPKDDYPVTCISWKDAVAFCEWLEDKTELAMRLPTEAEWEYACRAGETKVLTTPEELKEIAWIPENSNNQAHPVGKESHYNTWHICDMIGNVREWCQDGYGKYPNGSVTNPIIPPKGKLRIVRGGSWASALENCRPAARLSYCKKYRSSYQGFRVVCECKQQ